MPFDALHARDQGCSATFAVHQVEASRVALQEHAEFNQADQHRKEVPATSGEHVLVSSPLARGLVGLLSQDSRIDKLFEPRRGDLLREAGALREILETRG